MKVIAARQTLITSQTVEYIYHIVIHHHIHTVHTNCFNNPKKRSYSQQLCHKTNKSKMCQKVYDECTSITSQRKKPKKPT